MLIYRRRFLLASALLAFGGGGTQATAAEAPLRFVYLDGNPVQARIGRDGKPHGPAIDLAEAIGRRLGRPIAVRAVVGTGALAETLRDGGADLAFIAYDPTRAAGLRFTAPYLLSLNGYAVAPASAIKTIAQIDNAGVRVGAMSTDTGGLYLKRTLRNAELVPVASAPEGIEMLKAGKIDALGTSSQRLADLSAKGGFRTLPGSFYGVPQTIAVREDQPTFLAAASGAVEDARKSGALAGSIKRWNLVGTAAVPAAVKLPTATEAARDLAPTGRLRVAINLGNGVLAQRSPQGELTGVTVMLAHALADRLKIPLELIPFQAAGMVFDALDKGIWDVAFLAVEPERATRVDFSPPYVFIDGTYMVSKDAPFQKAADLDKAGVRIAVGRGAAYDLFLTRTLKQATLVRAPTSPAAVATFRSDHLEAAAGVRQFLADQAKGDGTVRILDDSFSRIDQAMGVPKGREIGAAYIKGFLEEMKSSGKIRKGLDATGQNGATVAPPAP